GVHSFLSKYYISRIASIRPHSSRSLLRLAQVISVSYAFFLCNQKESLGKKVKLLLYVLHLLFMLTSLCCQLSLYISSQNYTIL
ncbi:MAG: hypothetical protein LDL53_11295, partial [Candidatus Hydrogenedens sp.]|nr:hypothetical protein [Candidatus Hydrogenedens sp.]